MKIKVLTLIAISLFIISCENNDVDYVKPDFELQTPSDFEDEEIKIFQDYFEDKDIIVSQKTLANLELSYEIDDSYYADYGVTDLLETYNLINKESFYFNNSIYTENYNVQIVPFEEIEYFFSTGAFVDFDSLYQIMANNKIKFENYYPNAEGIYAFSRIAYNETNTKCYFTYQLINAEGGNNGSIFGEKANNKWTFIKMLEVFYN